MNTTFTIGKTSRSTPPRFPYATIKNDILGEKFCVSLVFVGNTLATRLNRERRNKAYTPNVLTFPLTATSGEIYINLLEAQRQAKKHNIPYNRWVLQLFIHGLLHLDGMPHSATMERKEQRLVKKYA